MESFRNASNEKKYKCLLMSGIRLCQSSAESRQMVFKAIHIALLHTLSLKSATIREFFYIQIRQ